MNRPTAENEWVALYAAANGFDGFLRWAAYLWSRDPFFSGGYGNMPGETFLGWGG